MNEFSSFHPGYVNLSQMGSAKKYPIVFWRSLSDLVASWLIIALAVYLCVSLSWWFYPLSALLIANRLLAISLIAHEALHYNLLMSKTWNDRIGRYLCAFPTCMSLSRYRLLHQMHHGALGSERWDPDHYLYDFYPVTRGNFFKNLVWKTITGQTAFAFFSYYTEFTSERSRRRDSDFVAFTIFWTGVIGFVLYFGWLTEYLLFSVVPFVFLLQPYVLIMGGLQHGGVIRESAQSMKSRTIKGPAWMIELLLPLHINWHGAHHFNPRVPHYWLETLAEDLKQSGIAMREESYGEAWSAMFDSETHGSRAVLPSISYR